jgi:hypothetical protein
MSSREERSAEVAERYKNDICFAEFTEGRECIVAAAAILNKPLPPWQFFHGPWQKGVVAKEKGFARVSPYYEDELRTPYWLAGYDGIEFIPPVVPTAVKPLESAAIPERASTCPAS